MSARLIKCERCGVESGARVEPEYQMEARPVQFYREDDGRIHCEACVDGEVEIREIWICTDCDRVQSDNKRETCEHCGGALMRGTI